MAVTIKKSLSVYRRLRKKMKKEHPRHVSEIHFSIFPLSYTKIRLDLTVRNKKKSC